MACFIRAVLLSLILLVIPAVSSAATYPSFNQPSASSDIVGFNIQNTGSASQPSRYVTWGQAFVQGKVPATASLTATIDGTSYPAQMDVKTKYSDGTVRFAVITVKSPTLSGNQTVKGMLAIGGSTGTPVNLTSALANYDAKIVLSGGLTNTVDVKAKLLEALNNNTATYWLQGQNAAQARVDVPISSSFHIVVDVTAYADGTFLTDAQFRNDYSMQATGGTVNYTATISQNGSNVYTSPALTHYQYEVWRRVFHTNGAPTSDTHNIQRDVSYYIKAGAVPNYDLASGITDSSIGSVSSTNIAPLSNTGYATDMGMTGDRDDIGPMPNWHAIWLRTQNAAASKHALAMANGGGSLPWHHFDPTTKDYISLDKYPALWIDDANRGATDLTQPIRDSRWRVETAHAPAVAMIPYVFTGDRYFLDEVNAQATNQIMMHWPAPRQDGKGIALDGEGSEVRAQAWTLRSIDEAAWANPDGTATKAYWQKILDNNYTNWINNEMPALTKSQGAVHGWVPGVYGNWPPSMASWQHDYMAITVAGSVLRGNNAKALTVLNWMSNFIVGRATNAQNGMDPAKAAPYNLVLGSGNGTPFTTWAQVGSANSVSVPTNDNYPAILSAALASVYAATGNSLALQGYNAFEALKPLGTQATGAYSATEQYKAGQAKFRIIPVGGTVTPPPPTPTQKFVNGDRITTTDNVNIRATPSPTGTLLGTKAVDSLGVVTAGPIAAGGYTWWNINYDTAPDGWSVEDFLVKSTAPMSAPAPTVAFGASPSSVTSGQSSTLSWSSTNATACTATGSWTGSKTTSGTMSVTPAVTATYTITCTGTGGTVSANTSVTVSAAPAPTPAPTVTLSANPTSVTTGGSVTLTWSSTNATACTASNGWTGTKATSGTQSVTPTASATYTITCTGAGGTASANASVGVSSVPLPPATTTPGAPTVTISANPTAITKGQSITLTWSSTNATSCTASGSWTGKRKLNYSRTFTPSSNATYTLTCSGKGGSASASASVTVTAPGTPAPEPTPTPTPEPTPAGIQVGDRVKLTTNTNVRATANGTILGTNQLDRQGTVTAGPASAGGYTWYEVNFDSGLDGFVAADYLVEISGTTPVPAPTPSTQTLTLGNTTTGTVTDSNNSNTLEITKFTTGAVGGTVQSMSVYIAGPVSAAPNNQYSLALYADSNDAPGTLIAQSVVGTLIADAWNTMPLTATVAPNTTYWLGYTTNGEDANHNNFRMSSGSSGQVRWRAQVFGTWPSNFGAIEGSDAYTPTIYLTYTSGQALGTVAARLTSTLGPTSAGTEVTLLQQLLKRFGFFPGEVTGYFGAQTAAAVRAFQTTNGLDVVGIVGSKTRALLNVR